jgi:hypothetical protein
MLPLVTVEGDEMLGTSSAGCVPYEEPKVLVCIEAITAIICIETSVLYASDMKAPIIIQMPMFCAWR